MCELMFLSIHNPGFSILGEAREIKYNIRARKYVFYALNKQET